MIVIGIFIFFLSKPKNQLSAPSFTQIKKNTPSETTITYTDPVGFSFNYPDNLSIAKNEIENSAIYADFILSSKQVSGSLSIKIADSKFKSIDGWAKLNNGSTKQIKLGNLKALEIKTNDRLLLGALDQGILFTLEMPLIEESFWTKVYNKVITDFSFAPPTVDTSTSGNTNSASDVSFEGEEVVE